MAGDKGMSREEILAHLWPERETESAGHTLNQLLNFQRRHCGNPDLFAGRDTLHLQPLQVESDVQVFEAALKAGRLAEAVEVYQGEFLDHRRPPSAPPPDPPRSAVR